MLHVHIDVCVIDLSRYMHSIGHRTVFLASWGPSLGVANITQLAHKRINIEIIIRKAIGLTSV